MQIVRTKQHSIFIWLLGLYLFLIPFDFIGVKEGVSLSKIFILLPLFGVLFEIGKFRSVHKKSIPLLLYVFVVGLTLIYTVNRGKTWERFMSVALNTGIIMICALRHYKKEEIRFLIKSIVYSGWLSFVLCLLIGINYLSSKRLSIGVEGFSQDPNYLTGYFFFSIAYYVWRFLETNKKKYLIPNILLLSSILLTGSRGGLIALVIVICATMLLSRKNQLKKVVVLSVFLGAFLMIMLSILPRHITERFSITFTETDRGAHRFEIWSNSMKSYMNASFLHQLFGYGGATITYFNPTGSVAHNIWIESLIEYGLVGALLILFMYLYYLRQAFKMKDSYIFGAFIGYMALMMSLSLYSYKPIWNILLLIILISKTDMGDKKVESLA